MDWDEDPDGATPLTEGQRKGLKLSWVATKADLNDAEAQNILEGTLTWQRRKRRLQDLLDDQVVRALHKDLFGDVWSWAGQYRTVDLNIGVHWYEVAMTVRDLTEDAKYWFSGTADSSAIDAAACRLHHRMVEVHPFPNGNGRHAREFTNLVLGSVGAPSFTWGSADLASASTVRTRYIEALRAADAREYGLLLAFVRS